MTTENTSQQMEQGRIKIEVRLSLEEKDAYGKSAVASGKSVSDWARGVLNEAAGLMDVSGVLPRGEPGRLKSITLGNLAEAYGNLLG